ncbi:type II secretion system (T2SS) protein F [Propionicimonas paludicola]|uniref:Type II secretion system (T2SS) protein F n=1 Tax=Propionicimonas paludicola TaxID=185243 RepID=A0A2A9CTH3_9ACTN|nr:type II secretion system F family protein [Propionicimonas paludicola]PFG17757.1 type II secretion system (T2SS) protein F [Propionicimonas paludicola]
MGWPLVTALAVGLAILLAWRQPALRLREADPSTGIEPARLARLRLAGLSAALGFAAGLVVDWWAVPLGLAAGAAGYLASGRLKSAAEAARSRALASAVPGLCDLIAVCLDAGLPLRNAVAELGRVLPGPAGEVMNRLGAAVALGTDEAAAWRELAAAEPELAELGRELARSLDYGLTATATLRVIGERARRVELSRVQQRARRVGVSSVLPLVLCLLPSFLLIGVVPVVGGVVQRFFG